MGRIPIALLLLGTAPAFAQDNGPSFDCTKAESSAEELVCEDAELARLDHAVSARYAAAIDVINGMDSGAEDAKNKLRATQRGWIKGRDECWKASDLGDCVAFSYLRREAELVTEWMLQSPTSVVFWACDDNPANEVVTSFFDTTLPSVRFERGDTIDTGTLVTSASGSKYEGNFGRSIWIKGKEASYRDPDPDGAAFTCVIARER